MTEKIPLVYAAELVERACADIDKADDKKKIDSFLLEAFNDSMGHLADSVDRRIGFDRWAKIQIKAAQEAYRYFRNRKALIKAVHDRFKERTAIDMEAHPDTPYRGTLGKISLVANQGSVEFAFGENQDLSQELVNGFGIPMEFLKSKLTYRVDTQKVKAALLEGRTFLWAKLKTGHHVRFPADRKPKPKKLEPSK